MTPEERVLRGRVVRTPDCYTSAVFEVAAVRAVLDELDQQRARADAAERDLDSLRRGVADLAQPRPDPFAYAPESGA